MISSEREYMRFQLYRFFITLIVILGLILPAAAIVQAQGDAAEVGVFEPVEVAPGATVQVPLSIRNVQNLYALDLLLEFDPALVQVVDVDTAMEGVQVGQGQFLEPGLLLFNIADNEEGTVRFTMSQYNPSEPKTGGGVLLVITFAGVAQGTSSLELKEILLSTNEGVEIPVQGVEGQLNVLSGAPAQQATIPVADTAGLILIPTFTPTPVPTSTPVPPLPTSTQKAAAQNVDKDTQQPSSLDPAGSDAAPSLFMLKNWWILLVLLVAVIAGGLTLVFKNKRTKKE